MNSTRKGKRKQQAVVDAILREDFQFFLRRCFMTLNPDTEFLPNWHLEAMGARLEWLRRGEINRLIINLPPRYLKSLTVSVAFPAFLLGHDPGLRIYVISYGSDLAAAHAADFRMIVESSWYRRAFPKMRVRKSTEDEVTTTKRGFRRAASVGGALTGLGGDIFIIDDPQKAADALSDVKRKSLNRWYSNTLISRLDNKRTGAIIIVTQRVHMDDLPGHALSTSKDWEILSIPAIVEVPEDIVIGDGEDDLYHREAGEALQPDRETVDMLRELERQDPYTFAAQYEQSPIPVEGAMIKRDSLRYYAKDELPKRTHKSKVIQSWDTAAKGGANSAWSVCTTWLVHNKIYYLLELTRGRYDYPQLRDTAVRLAQEYKPDVVLIEDTCAGTALAQELHNLLKRPIKPVPVHGNKVGRLFVEQRKFQAGFVRFPKDAPFLAELEAELLAFPNGKHDDQVDSITQALSHEIRTYDSSMEGLSNFYRGLAFEATLRRLSEMKR